MNFNTKFIEVEIAATIDPHHLPCSSSSFLRLQNSRDRPWTNVRPQEELSTEKVAKRDKYCYYCDRCGRLPKIPTYNWSFTIARFHNQVNTILLFLGSGMVVHTSMEETDSSLARDVKR